MDQCVFVDVSSLSFAHLARLPGCFTFFKSNPWCWIQPVFPQLLYLFINVVLCWWQLTFWMVIMIAQSWVDLSFWETKSCQANYCYTYFSLYLTCLKSNIYMLYILGNNVLIMWVRLLTICKTASSPKSSLGTWGVSSL